jgi:hypothetical protein
MTPPRPSAVLAPRPGPERAVQDAERLRGDKRAVAAMPIALTQDARGAELIDRAAGSRKAHARQREQPPADPCVLPRALPVIEAAEKASQPES